MISSMWPINFCYLSLIYIDISDRFNSLDSMCLTVTVNKGGVNITGGPL